MTAWVCPTCRRQFGRRNQSHECAPAMTLSEYFRTGPPFERPIFDAVMDVLEPVGPVVVEPVSVGIFLKKSRGFAELRPMTKWVAVWFGSSRGIDHPRIARRMGKYHVVNVRDAAEVDDTLAGWLAQAYLESPD